MFQIVKYVAIPEVGEILEEFGRSFIGRLDPKIQENFAYKNAERMLQ